MPIDFREIAQVMPWLTDTVQVRSLHTDHVGKVLTIRTIVPKGADHEAALLDYDAVALTRFKEKEVGRFANHLRDSNLPQDFTRNHITVLQAKYVLLRVFVKEKSAAIAARMAQEINDHISDAEIAAAPLKDWQKAIVRPRVANLLTIIPALATDTDHVGIN